MKERPDPVEVGSNGGSPHYVLVREGGGHHTFGPYNKIFAEHIAEVFGGTVDGSEPSIVTEKVEVKKDEKGKRF